MTVGIISDIHNNISNLQKALTILNIKKVNIVFFCGDLTSASALKPFVSLKAPVRAVFGNMDKDKKSVLDEVKNLKINFKYPEGEGLKWDLEAENKRIVVIHGDNEYALNNFVNSNKFDFVFSGHSHSPNILQAGKTTWINPGSICGYIGLDKKPIRISLATLNLKTKKAEIVYL